MDDIDLLGFVQQDSELHEDEDACIGYVVSDTNVGDVLTVHFEPIDEDGNVLAGFKQQWLLTPIEGV